MAAITAPDAKILADGNATDIAAELDLIYAAITSNATAGKYEVVYALTNVKVKAAIISALTDSPNLYDVTVKEDGYNLLIKWGSGV